MEDYLESILKLKTINVQAKIKDIAKDLNVQMPSVIGALKTLRGKGLVLYEKSSSIESGSRVYSCIKNLKYTFHRKDFLMYSMFSHEYLLPLKNLFVLFYL